MSDIDNRAYVVKTQQSIAWSPSLKRVKIRHLAARIRHDASW
jgi:hypothetical protein